MSDNQTHVTLKLEEYTKLRSQLAKAEERARALEARINENRQRCTELEIRANTSFRAGVEAAAKVVANLRAMVIDTGTSHGGRDFEVDLRLALLRIRALTPPAALPPATEDSPNFVPRDLDAFAARGFKRENRQVPATAEPRTIDYCLNCNESPDSGNHLFGKCTYKDPRIK